MKKYPKCKPVWQLRCVFCKRYQPNDYILKQHLQMDHMKIIDNHLNFFCQNCNFMTRNSVDLIEHYAIHTIQCDRCQLTFASHIELKMFHYRITNHNVRRCPNCGRARIHRSAYRCELCGVIFRKRKNLKEHLIYGEHNETLRCQACALIFPNDNTYKFHLINHQFVCIICKIAFAKREDLLKHSAVYQHKKLSEQINK